MLSKKFLFTDKTSRIQFIKYVSTGFLGVAVEYTLFNILLHYLNGSYLIYNITIKNENIAHTLSLISGAIVCFIINKIWSFKSRGKNISTSVRYALVFTVNLIISNILFSLLTDQLHVIPQISKILVMGIVISWNFLIYKYFVYKQR